MKAVVLTLGFAFSASVVEAKTPPANVTADAASHKAKTAALIEPDLRPESSGEFFKNDYPHDDSHGHQFKTKYPYPVVQSSDTFDKDYVKDENNNKADGAAWDNMLKHGRAIKDAAEEVDRLKKKLEQAKEDLAKAKEKLEQEAKDVKEAEDALAKATPEKKDEPRPTPADTTTPQPVTTATTTLAPAAPVDTGDAAKAVEKELGDLEECKRQLQIAKAKLEALQKEAADAQTVMKEKQALKESAEQAEAIAKAEEDKLEVVVDKEQADYTQAQQTHEDAKASLEAMKKELDKAEEKLRHFRGEPVSKPSTKSAATRTALAATVAIFGAACLAA